MARKLQYPSLSFTALAPELANRGYFPSWFQPLATPRWDVPRKEAALVSSGFVPSNWPVPFVEPVRLSSWWQALSEPTRRGPTINPHAVPSYFGTETTPIEKIEGVKFRSWPPFNEPIRVAARSEAALVSAGFVPSNYPIVVVVTPSIGYLQPLSEPVRRIPSALPHGYPAVFQDSRAVVEVTKWQQPLSEPTRRGATINPHAIPSNFGVEFTPIETIQGPRFRSWSQEPDPVRRVATAFPHALPNVWQGDKPIVEISKWYAPLAEPVRPPLRSDAGIISQPVFTPPAVTAPSIGWFVQDQIPVRSRAQGPSPSEAAPIRFTIPSIGFFGQDVVPVRPVARPTPFDVFNAPFTPARAVPSIGWLVQDQPPIFPKRFPVQTIIEAAPVFFRTPSFGWFDPGATPRWSRQFPVQQQVDDARSIFITPPPPVPPFGGWGNTYSNFPAIAFRALGRDIALGSSSGDSSPPVFPTLPPAPPVSVGEFNIGGPQLHDLFPIVTLSDKYDLRKRTG